MEQRLRWFDAISHPILEKKTVQMNRRALLAGFLTMSGMPFAGGKPAWAQSNPSVLALTPDCSDHPQGTRSSEEGPYFKPKTPLRNDLAADAPAGERITVAGLVMDPSCRPVPRALIEIWHADDRGAYDAAGYRLRGHQLSDEAGRWWFTTIVPALYPGRTRHFHFKVQRPGRSVLTTQLFFPGEPQNARDSLFNDRLLLQISQAEDGKFGRFDFIV
jgi:protocatechuate 3,4-dioxygenase beta subunit